MRKKVRSHKKIKTRYPTLGILQAGSFSLSFFSMSRISSTISNLSQSDAYVRGESIFEEYQARLTVLVLEFKNFLVQKLIQDKVNFRRSLFLVMVLLYIFLPSKVNLINNTLAFPIFSKLHTNSSLNLSLQNIFPFSAEILGSATIASRLTTQTPTPTLSEASPSSQMSVPTLQPNSGFCMNAPVLLYHHVEPYNLAKLEGHAQLTVDSGYFDEQMKYLIEHGYHVIEAEELIHALLEKRTLPEKSIVVTLDDGYEDAYAYAFETAKKYNVVLNLMIPAGLIENKGYLTWNQIREMNSSGLIKMYDHTWSHFSLPSGDMAKQESEIMTAKKKLEEVLGYEQKVFTYPYGTVDNRSIEILKKNGFLGAFTTVHSHTQCDSFIYALHRDHVGNAPLSSYGL